MTFTSLFLDWILGPQCCSCGCRGAVRRRMGSSYNNDELNFTVECDKCFIHTEQYWADMWEDYYRGRM